MVNKVLNKLVRYEIMIRKAVNGHLDGRFKSIFKGSGLEFSDLRTYNYGDDTRLIDWNASSKGHGLFVKLFKEEKEQQIFLMLDVSGSQAIGVANQQKIDLGKEICATLVLSGIKEASKVGMYCFSEQKELFMPPENSSKHGYQLITKLFNLSPIAKKTNISEAILFVLQILKKKSIVILVSDFIDEGYEHNLRALARKHDLIVMHLYDKRETQLPRLGIIPVMDLETNQIVWANTSTNQFRKQMRMTFRQNKEILEQVCKENKADYVNIEPNENFVPKLIKLFKQRNRA